MFKKVTLRLIKTMWVLIASTVVLLAVLITALKYSLSYLNDYKSDIESYLHNTVGANIHIGAIKTSWQSSGPVLILSNVEHQASAQAPLDITIGTTRVEIDFWQSLMQQKFVSESFVLSGLETHINSEVFYRVRPSSEGSQLFEGLSQLFLSQLNSFKVENSLFRVRHKNGRTQNYYLESLQWRNDGNRHQAAGNIYVDGFSRNSIALALDLYGQNRRNIFGQIYLEAQQVDVSPWLEQLISDHLDIASTDVNFATWGTINNGLVEEILINLNDSYIHWGEETKAKHLGVKSAQFKWQKSADQWRMFGNNIVLDSNGVEYDGFNFTFRSEKEFRQLDVNRFNLAAVDSVFSLLNATKQSSALATAQLDGLVENLQVHWDKNQKPFAYAEINQFGFLPNPVKDSAYLGINNTSLELFWHDNTGLAKLRAKDGELVTKDTFSKTIDYQNLALDVMLTQYEEVLSVAVPRFKFSNEDIDVTLSSQYLDQAESRADYLALYGEVKGPKQGQIHHYLPKYLLSDDTYQYLNNAIQQGRGELTQILLAGDPTNLFDNEVSQFEIKAQLRDSLFRFSDDWPAIENFNSDLVVDSRLMSIYGREGQFSAMTLNKDITAQIDLAAPATTVQLLLTPEQMQLKQFHQLIDNTPLQQAIGDVFEFVRLDGDANATVHIAIPVSTDDPVDVQGHVITNDATLALPEIPLNFSNLNAVVSFNNSEFSITAEQGALFGLPVTFNVTGGDVGDNYQLQADLMGNWQHSDFVTHFPSQLNDYFDGEMASSFKVRVNLEEQGYQYFVSGRSDLTDTQYDITLPLVKSVGETSSLNTFVFGDEEGHKLELSLDDDLFFQGRISSDTGQFEQANLTIGSENSVLPASGFDIRLELQQTEFEPTLNFVTDLLAYLNQGESTGEPVMPPPHKVSGNIQNLSILGQEWQNVSLDAKPQTDSWLFSIGAKQTLSEITVFDDIDEKGIHINSSFLHIEVPTDEEKQLQQALSNTPENNNEEATVAPEQPFITDSAALISALPPITANCQSCTYNGKPLGTIELVTRTKASELLIEKAAMTFERNSVNLTGKWVGDEGEGHTHLSGQINSRYFGDWLKHYDLNTGMKESDAKINLDVGWDSAPFLFNYETLSGKADFRLGEGYLSEVSDKGVRIVSLLSLDSLYRKLKLDFNDIFAKGLFYNNIRGNVVLKDGVAYSEDIKMDGVAGNMDMSGFTDLNKDTIDYNVSFRPKLTSSLGVLSWLAAANPVTIIGAFALDKILEDADVLAEMRLKISGPLNKPDVKEVKRFTKKAEMPSKEEIERFRQDYLKRTTVPTKPKAEQSNGVQSKQTSGNTPVETPVNNTSQTETEQKIEPAIPQSGQGGWQ